MSNTPHIIESTLTNVGQPFGDFQGPFINGSNRYVVVNDFTIAGGLGASKIGVFKSTDGGLTWTVQDQIHAPSFGVAAVNKFGTTLYIIYNTGGATNSIIIPFDLTTDLYGTTITNGPPAPGVGSGIYAASVTAPVQVVKLSNGHFVSVYTTSVSSRPDLYINEYGGSWGSPTLIKAHSGTGATAVDPLLLTIVVDPTDKVHITRIETYADIGTGFPGLKVIYCSYSGGVLSGDTQIGSNITGGINNKKFGKGFYVSSNNSIAIPTTQTGGFGTPKWFSIIRIDATSGAITFEGISDGGVDDNFISPKFVVSPDGNTQSAFCYTNNNTPVSHEQIVKFTHSGTWNSTYTVWWDEIADAPTPPQDLYNDYSPFSIMQLTNAGVIGATVGLFYPVTGGDFCAVQFYLETPGVATLTLACPVGGGSILLGTPYDHFMVRTGGLGPFTFAVTGGALPPGLSLNTGTGEISGTPTMTGNYTFTITVTDSLGSTSSATCSITVTSNAPTACVLFS